MLQLIYIVTLIFNLFYLNKFCSAAIWEEELYGSGKFVEGHYDKNANTHLSSSTEDLKLLFKAELDIVKFVKNMDHDSNTTLLVQRYLGGFQLLDLIIKELKSHMTCYNLMPLIG